MLRKSFFYSLVASVFFQLSLLSPQILYAQNCGRLRSSPDGKYLICGSYAKSYRGVSYYDFFVADAATGATMQDFMLSVSASFNLECLDDKSIATNIFYI